MEDILKKLGARIREERKKAKLTQEKFAEVVGLSADYIGYVERGKQAPYLKTLERIANALNVQVYELFIFRKKDIDKKEEAIEELISCLRNEDPADIRFIAHILKQIFERKKTERD